MNYSDLFKSTEIGKIKAANHFLRSATAENAATDDGMPTKYIQSIYNKLIKSGIGTIITSFTYISDYEKPSRNQLGIYDDRSISSYKIITEEVHRLGGKIVMQIVHGSSVSQANPYGAVILGPSRVVHPQTGLTSKEMDYEDMEKVKDLFSEAALRAKRAGFDGVQIHAAHGYLLSQFMSPIFNKREDKYGGEWRNRIRFIEEVYDAIREKVGTDYPIWIKMNSSDETNNGLSVEEFLKMAEHLDKKGIDAIEVSGDLWYRHGQNEFAYYKDAAVQLADRVRASVILTGGLKRKDEIEEIRKNSNVNYFGFSRALIKDEHFIDSLK